jgi:hypothetical protein
MSRRGKLFALFAGITSAVLLFMVAQPEPQPPPPAPAPPTKHLETVHIGASPPRTVPYRKPAVEPPPNEDPEDRIFLPDYPTPYANEVTRAAIHAQRQEMIATVDGALESFKRNNQLEIDNYECGIRGDCRLTVIVPSHETATSFLEYLVADCDEDCTANIYKSFPMAAELDPAAEGPSGWSATLDVYWLKPLEDYRPR